MKDLDVDLKKLFRHKLLTHTFYNPLLNREDSDNRAKKIINNEKYFDFLFEEYLKIEERTFDDTYYRFSKYGTENSIANINKSFEETKDAFLKGNDMSAYYIQDYTKHKTINIIDNVFSKYNIYEREFLNYLETNQTNTDVLYKTICNFISQISCNEISIEIVNKIIESNENVTLSIQDLSICESKLSTKDIQTLKEKWIVVKDELNILLNEYLSTYNSTKINVIKDDKENNAPKVLFTNPHATKAFLEQIQNFITPDTYEDLRLLVNENTPISQKIIFMGNQNQLAELLKRMKYNNLIKSTIDNLSEWICNNFNYYNKQNNSVPFNNASVLSVLKSFDKEPPKNKRICISDFHYPYKLEKERTL
ncbi:hypothetical protein ACTS9C_00910 [Empedobacter brevis]